MVFLKSDRVDFDGAVRNACIFEHLSHGPAEFAPLHDVNQNWRIGSGLANFNLSERRAKTVRDFLIRYGVEESRITAVGYGESQPIATNDTEEGRAQNRRVELRIIE